MNHTYPELYTAGAVLVWILGGTRNFNKNLNLWVKAKLKYVLPTNKLKQVADGMFNSVLIYCLPVYGGCEKGDLKLLQVLQNQASRLFTKCPTKN